MRRFWITVLFGVAFSNVLQLSRCESSPTVITNSDVVSMTRAGIGDQTIILAIHRGPDKFDTSPQALVALKRAGVTDKVLNAILSTPNTENSAGASSPSFKSSEISDPTERMIFERISALTDLRDKSSRLKAFLELYPQSVARPTVLAMLAEIKRQMPPDDSQTQAQSSPSPTQASNRAPIQQVPHSDGEGLTLRVIQEQSVPYTRESGGGISTTCSIVGLANTSAYVNAYGNNAYGDATTNSNERMTCNSYDTTIRWPHVLNVMFVQASDGNAYIIACDRAWRWSKCNPLRAGDVFNASFTGKGIEVRAVNGKGREVDLTYQILQSKVWR